MLISDIGSALQQLGDPFKIKDIGQLVSLLVSMGLIIASLLVLLYLVWGGIQWISSGGDKQGLESAKNRLTAAVIGLTIVAASWAIFLLLKTFLVLPILTPGSGSGGGGGQIDCCSYIGGSQVDRPGCCIRVEQVGCLTGGRYHTSVNQCSQTIIDWTCWKNNYPADLNASNDPCRTNP